MAVLMIIRMIAMTVGMMILTMETMLIERMIMVTVATLIVNPNARTVNKGRKPDDPDLEESLNDWCESLLAENISF
jgi:hypothetical protein